MQADSGHSVFDPDLDVSRPRRVRIEVEPIEEYQRLLANPFLAVLCWVVVFFVVRQALRLDSFALFLVGLVLLSCSILMVQYHCLDCGATGWLIRCRRHACPDVVRAQNNPGTWRRRGPRVETQIVVWLYGLVAVAVLLVVAYLAR